MSNIIEGLKNWGCDMEGAMERFLDDEDFYLDCLKSVAADDNFELLGQALQQQDAQKAFEYAHTLKGLIGNMGLTPMYNIVVEIVEPLRSGSLAGVQVKYGQLMQDYAKLQGMLNA